VTVLNRKMQTVLIAILVAAFVVSGIWLGVRSIQAQAARQDYRQAEAVIDLPDPTPEVTSTPEPTATPTPAPEVTPVPTPEPSHESTPEPIPEPTSEIQNDPMYQELEGIDLAELRATNSDVVGWITIPGTPLSYPLMQGTDNQYYLNHTWKKTKSAVGAIYLDYRNSDDMSDFNSIIYGHRMSDSSMFNCLRHYSDQSYFEEHPSIYIVTDEGVLRYEIFAAYEADAVSGHTYRLGLVEEEGQQAYINYCSRRSGIEIDVIPEPGDHIITLSTCVSPGGNYDTRWVVQAVRKGAD